LVQLRAIQLPIFILIDGIEGAKNIPDVEMVVIVGVKEGHQ